MCSCMYHVAGEHWMLVQRPGHKGGGGIRVQYKLLDMAACIRQYAVCHGPQPRDPFHQVCYTAYVGWYACSINSGTNCLATATRFAAAACRTNGHSQRRRRACTGLYSACVVLLSLWVSAGVSAVRRPVDAFCTCWHVLDTRAASHVLTVSH